MVWVYWVWVSGIQGEEPGIQGEEPGIQGEEPGIQRPPGLSHMGHTVP